MIPVYVLPEFKLNSYKQTRGCFGDGMTLIPPCHSAAQDQVRVIPTSVAPALIVFLRVEFGLGNFHTRVAVLIDELFPLTLELRLSARTWGK